MMVRLTDDNTKKVRILAAERSVSCPTLANWIIAEYASLREDLVSISKRLKTFHRRKRK